MKKNKLYNDEIPISFHKNKKKGNGISTITFKCTIYTNS